MRIGIKVGKFGPDFNFGPDIVCSEPISKVASGNHGGNGHAVPPLVFSQPLDRANHNVGVTNARVFCASWASRGQHSDPGTRHASPIVPDPPKIERRQNHPPTLGLHKEAADTPTTSTISVACAISTASGVVHLPSANYRTHHCYSRTG